MNKDKITLLRNEFSAVIDRMGENCLCSKEIIDKALALEHLLCADKSIECE